MSTTGMQTILEISNERRDEIKTIVLEAFSKCKVPSLPLKIGSLIRSYPNIKLITFSSQMKKYGVSLAEFIAWAGTNDAFCIHLRGVDRYCIYYNDISPQIVNSNRVRWNLAHELGHILLRHHELCNTEKLFRGTVNAYTYSYLELEADYFAQLLLVPHVALLYLNVKDANGIWTLCKISRPAALRRFNEYRAWRRNLSQRSTPKNYYDSAIYRIFYDFIFKKECPRCGSGFVQHSGSFCPICGCSSIKRGDGNRMKYPLLSLNSRGKVAVCPRCQNEDTDLDGVYCQICSAPLVNYCTNPNCQSYSSPLPSNARYCPLCSSISTFFHQDLLVEWDQVKQSSVPFVDFSNYLVNSRVSDDNNGELPF